MGVSSSAEEMDAVVNKVNKKFQQFLVGKGYTLVDDDFMDGLQLEQLEQEEANEHNPSGWTDRILLDVEKARVEREEAEKRKREKDLTLASSYFRKRFVSNVVTNLADTNGTLKQILRIFPSTVDLLAILALPYPRLSVIASMLDQNPEIRKRILYLVGSSNFMEQLERKPREVKDTQAAIGLIGTEILKYIVPAMIFKYRIKMSNDIAPLLGKKLWRHIFTTGMAVSYLLEKDGYKRPSEGLVLAALVHLGDIACFHQFLRSFDDTMTDCLNEARKNGDKVFHDLLFDVQPDMRVLEKLLDEKAPTLSLELAEQGFYDSMPQLVTALEEEVRDKDYAKRSLIGKALYRGIRFSRFEQLRAAKIFYKDELSPYLKYAQLDMDLFREMHKAGLHRLNYSKFR